MNLAAPAGSIARSSTHNISRAALLLTGFMVLQKLLALVQQVLIGRVAGFTAETDAFYIAQTFPLLVGAWIMVSLTTTLIPALSASDGRQASGLLLSNIAFLAIGTVALFIFARPVIAMLGHGFPQSTAGIAVRLLRAMAILIFLLGATGILNALYYRHSRFLIPSIASCLLYVGAIGGVLMEPWFGIDTLAWGLVAGGIGQVVMLCWFVGPQQLGRPTFAARQFATFSNSFFNISAIASIGIIWVMIDRSFGSAGQAGTVAAVTIASSLMTIPSAMIVTTLTSALLPTLVQLKNDRDAFTAMIRQAITYVLFILGPATMMLYFGSDIVLKILFRSTKLDAHSMLITSGLLAAYSIGIIAMAFKDVFSSALIALGREWLAMAAGLVILLASAALKLCVSIAQNPSWIAMSTSVAMWIGAIVLLIATAVMLPIGWSQFWVTRGWRLLVANTVFAAICLMVRPHISPTSVAAGITLFGAAGIAYLAVAWFLQLDVANLRMNAAARKPYGK